MVQTFKLRGANLISPKSLGRYAKVFGEVRQRLWGGVPKSLGSQTLYHAAPYFVPSGIIHCTMRRGAINGIAPHKKKDLTFRVKSFFLLWVYMFYFSNPWRRIDSTCSFHRPMKSGTLRPNVDFFWGGGRPVRFCFWGMIIKKNHSAKGVTQWRSITPRRKVMLFYYGGIYSDESFL